MQEWKYHQPVLVGGIFEGTIGLFAKYWRKIIAPVVAASVVTAIGFSLFTVGARSFGGGYVEDFGLFLRCLWILTPIYNKNPFFQELRVFGLNNQFSLKLFSIFTT